MSRSILKSTAIFSLFTVLAQVLAVLRDVVLVRVAGVGPLLDAYYMAFKIPDLLSGFYAIFLGSAIFVPLITKAKKEGGEKEVANVVSSTASFVFLIISGAFIILYFAMPILVQMIVPQWSGAQHLQAIDLSRILLWSQLIFPLGILAGALCMVYGRVGFAAISSALYNLGIVVGAYFLFPIFGIHGVAYGVIFGAFMFFLVQFWPKQVRDIFKEFYFHIDYLKIKAFIKENSMRFVSTFLWQFFVLMLFMVAATYGDSSVSIFNIAYGVEVSMIAIVGASISSVMLPIFSKLHVDQDVEGLNDSLNTTTFYTLYISIFIAFIAMIFSYHWLGTLFYFSDVPYEKLLAISNVFTIFMLAFPLQNYWEIVRRYFYSTNKVVAVADMVLSFMIFFASFIFIVKFFLPQIDSVLILPSGFLISNIFTLFYVNIKYGYILPLKYKEIFHNLLPMLLAIPLSALLWYTISTYTNILQSQNPFIYLLKNVSLLLFIILVLLYILRDSVVRGLVRRVLR